MWGRLAASERKGPAATLAHRLLVPLLVISLMLAPVPPCMLETAWAWSLPSLPGRQTTAGTPQPLAPAAPGGRLQEVPPPAAVQQLQQALAERLPQITISSPRDGATLPDGPWTLKLKLRDWPLADAGALGLGAHVVVQIDDQPPQRITAGEDKPTLTSGAQSERQLVLQQAPLAPGSHRLTVYAARPWGEAVKSPGAVRQIRLHHLAANPLSLPALDTPQLLPVSPNASNGGEPLLLDWLLLDAPLQNLRDGDASWRLRVTINGDTFLVDQAVPLWLRGWKSGRNILQLELLDGIGEPLNPPFNSFVEAIDLAAPGADPATRPRWLQGRLSNDELAILLGDKPPPQPERQSDQNQDADIETAAEPEATPEAEAQSEFDVDSDIKSQTKSEPKSDTVLQYDPQPVAEPEQTPIEPEQTGDDASAAGRGQGPEDPDITAPLNTTRPGPTPAPPVVDRQPTPQEQGATADPAAAEHSAASETHTSDQDSSEQLDNDIAKDVDANSNSGNGESDNIPGNDPDDFPDNNPDRNQGRETDQTDDDEPTYNNDIYTDTDLNNDTHVNDTHVNHGIDTAISDDDDGKGTANADTNVNTSNITPNRNDNDGNKTNTNTNTNNAGIDIDVDEDSDKAPLSDNPEATGDDNTDPTSGSTPGSNAQVDRSEQDVTMQAEPAPEPPVTPPVTATRPEALLGGSARELVNPDGTLMQPATQGPLTRLRQLLQR